MSDRLVGRLAKAGIAAPGRVLLIGDAARGRQALEASGWTVVVATDARDFGVDTGSCDVVVAENVLVRDPWDRWALQRIHRALRTGGVLLLSEPHQMDLATPSGLVYVARGAAREAARMLAERRGAPPRPSLRGRRPAPRALAATLAGLRFEIVDRWMERRGGWALFMPGRFAPRLGVLARTKPSIAGLADAWPDRDAHMSAYRRAQAAMLETRERWVRAHPARVPIAVATFDPAAYAGRTVLVLSPHPDDEVIGAGGTMLRLVHAGARVVVVQATDGAAGAAIEALPPAARREARLWEASAVADRIGVAQLDRWEEDNRRFRAEPRLVERLASLLEAERPALVLLPFVTEGHADHLTLCTVFARALERLAQPLDAQVFSYEVWSIVPPTHVLDVTTLMPEIESLLFEYDLAMRVDDFVHFCADRALFHAYESLGAPAYLEAFHAVPARDYPALLATVTSGP